MSKLFLQKKLKRIFENYHVFAWTRGEEKGMSSADKRGYFLRLGVDVFYGRLLRGHP